MHDLLRGVGAQSGVASVTAQRGQCLCCDHAVAMGRHVTKNAAMAYAPIKYLPGQIVLQASWQEHTLRMQHPV